MKCKVETTRKETHVFISTSSIDTPLTIIRPNTSPYHWSALQNSSSEVISSDSFVKSESSLINWVLFLSVGGTAKGTLCGEPSAPLRRCQQPLLFPKNNETDEVITSINVPLGVRVRGHWHWLVSAIVLFIDVMCVFSTGKTLDLVSTSLLSWMVFSDSQSCVFELT